MENKTNNEYVPVIDLQREFSTHKGGARRLLREHNIKTFHIPLPLGYPYKHMCVVRPDDAAKAREIWAKMNNRSLLRHAAAIECSLSKQVIEDLKRKAIDDGKNVRDTLLKIDEERAANVSPTPSYVVCQKAIDIESEISDLVALHSLLGSVIEGLKKKAT